MSNIAIYPGSSSFTTGSTPFGFYDTDSSFQTDADRVALYCAQRMGYPLVDIELQARNFYTAFEEAVTTYGNEIYAYKVRQDYLSLEGIPTASTLNHALVTPNMGVIIRISEQYGTEAGTGGNLSYRTGSIALTENQQDYDLNVWASESGYTEGDLEIKRIFYEAPPAVSQFYDPYSEFGLGSNSGSGLGGTLPITTFTLTPLSLDIQLIQSIEMNNQVRKSNFSFELVNNKLRIFPIPTNNVERLHFQYILKSERISRGINTGSAAIVTNISNVPYTNPSYTQINSIGRSWIFEYTLALSKEMLGYVRGKYSAIPIPGSEVTLNQGDLIASATEDKKALLEKLRMYLEETSREKLLERKASESDFRNKELGNVPFVIYLG